MNDSTDRRNDSANSPDPGQQLLEQLDRALRFARARLSPDISAQRLLILLSVYFNEGMSQRELLDELESTSITALSRNLADLSAFTTRKTTGPGLLEMRTDPMNLRIKRVHLTPKGRKLIRDWVNAIERPPVESRRAVNA